MVHFLAVLLAVIVQLTAPFWIGTTVAVAAYVGTLAFCAAQLLKLHSAKVMTDKDARRTYHFAWWLLI
ncbi:MAG: hypothetical protein ACYDBQ_00230 [Thermoplasmatota archaeon]